MNTPSERPEANHPINDADALLGDWIQEAGDPSMKPRAEHIDDLREKLLSRTRQTQPSQIDKEPEHHQKAARRTVRQWSVLAVVTAVVLIAVSLNPGPGRKDAAWAQVKEAVRAMPWMMKVM